MYATSFVHISHAEMRNLYEIITSEGKLRAAAHMNRLTNCGVRIAITTIGFIMQAFHFANSAIVIVYDAIDNIDVLPMIDGFKITIQHVVPQSS